MCNHRFGKMGSLVVLLVLYMISNIITECLGSKNVAICATGAKGHTVNDSGHSK